MPTSLVTGGAGFIGSHLAQQLISRGHVVVVLDDLSGGFVDNVPAGAEFVEGSITDPGQVSAVFESRTIDYVFHCAAYAAEGLSHFIKRFNYANNLLGSVNLINEAIKHKVRCFVFTSSIAVYGAGQLPMTEDMNPVPDDPYGIAKLAVEQELRVSKHMFDLDYIIFRPHNVYGERQNIGDRYRNVVGIFMNQCMKGEPMAIFGDGLQERAFTYIDDVAPIIAASVDVPSARNQVFNIGSDERCSVLELAHAVAVAMHRPPQIVHLEARSEVKIAYSDHSRLHHHFRVRSKTPLGSGLAAMAAWAQEHGSRKSRVFEDIEVRDRLPACWAASLG